MTLEYLRINDGDLLPLHTIKRISAITPQERASLAELGEHVDADAYGSRIDFAGSSKKCYARETVSDFRIQGARLVEIKDGAFVLADQIVKARNLTDKDRVNFEERTGRKLGEGFVSQIDLKSGKVLSAFDAAQVMREINQPDRPVSQSRVSTAPAEVQPDQITIAPEV